MTDQQVRVRFAPSPTGPLHIGGVRTALYNYLFARKHQGKLILRIEDTDSARFVSGAEAYIVEAFRWLGITFDEGIGTDQGEYGPYRQSERREIYQKYVKQLLDKGKAYYAFDTPEELEAKRKEYPNFQYDASTRDGMCNSLTLSEAEICQLKQQRKYTVRLKVEPNQDVTVHDLIRGEVHVNSSIIDDKVLYKSADELPTYHLANIVDDHLMRISHVIRGEEWLPSAPLHVLLYRALGWETEMPQFAHLPLLLKPEGNGKLSKRDGDRLGFPVFPLQWTDPKTGEISSGYREKGYLPAAVINFLAFLGWNPGGEEEIYSLDELISLFSLEHCSKSGAKFDYKKGIWFNHQYILHNSDEEIARMFVPVLREHGVQAPFEQVTTTVRLMKDRVNFVPELWDIAAFFFIAPQTYDEKALDKLRKDEHLVEYLQELTRVLTAVQPSQWKVEPLDALFHTDIFGDLHFGNLMKALRLALVGELKGPGIFDLMEALGKAETLVRLQYAIDRWKS